MNTSISLRRRSRAVTLLENIIAAAILLTTGAGTVSIQIYSLRTTQNYFWHGQMGGELRNASALLARDIRHAVSLESTYEAYAADAGTLILKLPALDTNRDPLDIGSKFDRIIYYSEDGTLYRQILPHEESFREAGLQEVGKLIQGSNYGGTFASQPSALGAEVIHYQFLASHASRSGAPVENRISGSVRLRNKGLS